MTRALAAAVALMLAVASFTSTGAQLAGTGVVTGTLSGSGGPLAGATVQVLDQAGAIVGSTVTTEAGVFTIQGLSPGTFVVQAVGASGEVIGAASATLVQGAMTATLTIEASAGVLAATAAAAVSSTAGGLSSATVLGAVAASAGALGTAAVIATQESVSESR